MPRLWTTPAPLAPGTTLCVAPRCPQPLGQPLRGCPHAHRPDNGVALRSLRNGGQPDSETRATVRPSDPDHLQFKNWREEGRGKIERWWEHVQSSFLPELQVHPAATLEELQALFDPWLDRYHHRVHSETGEAPIARWERHRDQFRFPDPIALTDAFLFSRTAHVDKTAVVRLHGNRYEVERVLCGQRVELRYDPLDLGQVRVFFQGRRYADARPLQLHRQTDPDIEVPLEQQRAAPVSDYLGSLQNAFREQRRQQLGGLRFAQRLLTPKDSDREGDADV